MRAKNMEILCLRREFPRGYYHIIHLATSRPPSLPPTGHSHVYGQLFGGQDKLLAAAEPQGILHADPCRWLGSEDPPWD